MSEIFFQDEKKHFVSPSNHVIFFLLYKILTQYITLFPVIFFWKIFQDLFKGQSNISEHFPKISQVFRKFNPKDNPRLTKTFQEDPKV